MNGVFRASDFASVRSELMPNMKLFSCDVAKDVNAERDVSSFSSIYAIKAIVPIDSNSFMLYESTSDTRGRFCLIINEMMLLQQ